MHSSKCSGILTYKKTTHNNFSPKQREALLNIQENNEIIVKETDMGNEVVILNKIYYGRKIQKILRDETNYELINTN